MWGYPGVTLAICRLSSLEGSPVWLVTVERCDDHRISFFVLLLRASLGSNVSVLAQSIWGYVMCVDDSCIIVRVVSVRDRSGA
ncbi:hypothetical protein BKA65DRAFT_82570 [Rhexocercosporidium sp. MPI-PUGE-AT-0058]|nr:hypothetical protein BKA65DRAFT_82570 [Rhexocercosporidium sp. MPI-PUGE-AT-0058]